MKPRAVWPAGRRRVVVLVALSLWVTFGALLLVRGQTRAAADPPVVYRIMPLGDSLTEGNYPGKIHSYRGYLRAKLLANGYTNVDFVGHQSLQAHGDPVPLDSDNSGRGGYTIGPDTQRFCPTCETTGLYEHINGWLSVAQPDIILLLIGLNDLVAADAHPPNYAQTAPDRLEALVDRIQEQRPDAIILLSSLLQTKESTAGWQKYHALNSRAAEIGNASATDSVYFVDLNAIEFEDADYFDNVHLVESGARKLADGWYDALVPFLTPATPVPTLQPTGVPGPTIELAAGWNLVSLSGVPSGTAPAAAFSSIHHQLVSAYAYRALADGGAWSIYIPNAPDYVSDLAVDETMGLWLHVSEACTLQCPGTPASSASIALQPGWNLVGCSLQAPQPVGQALASIAGKYRSVWGFSPSTVGGEWQLYQPQGDPHGNSLELLWPGRGYWIYATEACTWTY